MSAHPRAKNPLLLAALLALALLVSACDSDTGSATAGTPSVDDASDDASDVAEEAIDGIELEEGVEVDFWHIQATIYGDAITEMVAEFNETNEWGIVVNEVYKGSYDELNQAIRAALAGGGVPDVAMAYENDTLEYVAANEIVPLAPTSTARATACRRRRSTT